MTDIMVGAPELVVMEKVTEEIMVEVEAQVGAEAKDVDAETLYEVAGEVISAFDDEDEKTKEILGQMTDAVSKLEVIHAGESGAVSDILMEIMYAAYGSEAPTPATPVEVEE